MSKESKSNFYIKQVSKGLAAELLLRFHYLKDISKGFRSGFNYGCFENGIMVGVIVFTGFPVPELSKGMLGLERDDQEGLFELSRLCMYPEVQGREHNITSWFVARSIKQLRKDTNVRVILSYADSEYHNGTIYKACNFDYYGLTDAKTDFWIKQTNGKFIKHSRGKIKGIEGDWRDRSRKHRFLLVFDKTLNVLWEKEEYLKPEVMEKRNTIIYQEPLEYTLF